jgi:urease accessory protein
MTLNPGVLLLADGRTPTGGLSHSGGVEEAVRAGIVTDEASLLALLEARLETAGLTAAGIAAAACTAANDPAALELLTLELLDGEVDARMPSDAARAASRAQGRGLLRLARASWPHKAYAPGGPISDRPHHALVLGVATAAAGGTPADAASLAALASISGPASAAVRLLGLDPIAVTGLLARLGPRVEQVAERAMSASDLPATGHPLFDVLAQRHAAHGNSLFTS